MLKKHVFTKYLMMTHVRFITRSPFAYQECRLTLFCNNAIKRKLEFHLLSKLLFNQDNKSMQKQCVL